MSISSFVLPHGPCTCIVQVCRHQKDMGVDAIDPTVHCTRKNALSCNLRGKVTILKCSFLNALSCNLREKINILKCLTMHLCQVNCTFFCSPICTDHSFGKSSRRTCARESPLPFALSPLSTALCLSSRQCLCARHTVLPFTLPSGQITDFEMLYNAPVRGNLLFLSRPPLLPFQA